MSGREQPPEPVAELIAAARRVVPGWLRRITVDAARRGGADVGALDADIDAMVASTSPEVLAALEDLLGRDVDDQLLNPLHLLRDAVAAPTELLRANGVRARPVDPFLVERFPDDVYGIGPAAWSDVHPDLHEAGMVWGAWKAMTVLRRRREEGLR